MSWDSMKNGFRSAKNSVSNAFTPTTTDQKLAKAAEEVKRLEKQRSDEAEMALKKGMAETAENCKKCDDGKTKYGMEGGKRSKKSKTAKKSKTTKKSKGSKKQMGGVRRSKASKGKVVKAKKSKGSKRSKGRGRK